MSIIDSEIKDLIRSYQTDNLHYNKIREILSDYIYHFPVIAFETNVRDEDLKGDFYLYVTDRLEKILKNYKIMESASFKTYFYLALRSHFLNFIRLRKKPILNEKPIEDIEEKAISETDKSIDLDKISLIFCALPPKYRLILKLRCPDFLLPEDILQIGKTFQKEPAELLKKISLIFEDTRKKENRRIKELSAKSRLDKSSLSALMPLTSPRIIADFLGVKSADVSRWLFKIRQLIEEKVGDVYVS